MAESYGSTRVLYLSMEIGETTASFMVPVFSIFFFSADLSNYMILYLQRISSFHLMSFFNVLYVEPWDDLKTYGAVKGV